MSDQEQLPPEFDDCLNRWHQSDTNMRIALERYRVAPSVVNRLAVDAAWAAIEPTFNELVGWSVLFPRSRASQASGEAEMVWEGLHDQIAHMGLLEKWGGP